MPLPPPPAAALMIIGYPMFLAISIVSLLVAEILPVPGTHCIPELETASFAEILLPMILILSGSGPIKVYPLAWTCSAK